MITIISATDRHDSMTLKVAKLYLQLFSEKAQDVQLLSLEGKNVWNDDSEDMKEIENTYLIPANKIVLVMPEYNGSFPGILKLMMDNNDIKKCWWYKKAMLVGVADGRGGNLRGIEHMTNILHYLKVHVLYNKIPISRVKEEISGEGQFLKPNTLKAINEQIQQFIDF